MKQLIVNADDFGVSPGVNRGILHAHKNGIVTSTTVMVNFPDAAPGLEQALATAPDLGIGLHFNLTAGRPVSPPDTVRSLMGDDGQFYPIAGWPARLLAFEDEHLEREMVAQVSRFVALVGRPPDHFDAHHHSAYLHPAALRTMLDLARRYHIPMREGVPDVPLPVGVRMLRSMMPDLTDDAARGLLEQFAAVVADGPAPFWPARFEMGFSRDRATLGDLLVILTNLPDGRATELMTHPGYADDASHAWRENDLAHLTAAATLECVRSEGIQLITFGDITH